jgi:FtsP/CotA-like multicopper oxidase with cupredoxin domain
MSRNRIAIVAAVVVAFVVVAGYLIYKNQSGGGGNVTINVTVTHANSMSPSELDAHQNDTVTINITSDTDGEVHLHGYDIPFDCKAGQVTSHTFKADKTGDFEIEWESTSTHLGHLVVTP